MTLASKWLYILVLPFLAFTVFTTPVPVLAVDDNEKTEETEETKESEDTTDADEALDELEANQEALEAKQGELSDLDSKIKELSGLHESASQQAELAATQLSSINGQLQVTELALQQTALAITVTASDIEEIIKEIRATEEDLDDTRARLSDTMRLLYAHENTSLLEVFFGAETLSGLMSERRTYHALQEGALDIINELRVQQESLAEQHQKLSQRQDSLQQLNESQSYQKADLKVKQGDKDKFLTLQKAEQAKYEQKIAEAKQARTEIEQSLFKLQALGLEIGLNDAFAAAKYASNLTGVRPALILGIVKIETNVGANVGSGKFPDDMHPGSREAFLRITKKLDIDPYETQVSRKPTTYTGWGGAMGPGQIMPATWEHLEARISSLTGNPAPSPFELVDSLVGVGIMMSDRGAADPQKETEAVGRYLAGPNWQYHMWYVNKVLAVAAEYEKEF